MAQDVTGKTGGINAVTPGDGNISVTAGNVTTVGGTGINATTTGLGSVTVAGSGNVTTGALGTGINATITNAANASDVIVNRTGGNVTGDKGIVAKTDGTGNVNVTAFSVTANKGNAIDAQASGFGVSDGAVTVTTFAGGVISANTGTGILVQNSLKGSGGITVLSDAAIKVSGGTGIFAVSNQGTGDIKITSNGAIGSGTGGAGTLNTGILAAMNPGANGNITVGVNADIGSATDAALFQGVSITSGGSNNLGNIDVGVTKASIFATSNGIDARMFGKGNVTITGTGTGTISAANGTGISTVINNANPGNITVNVAQDVTGKTGGINAVTPGTGNIDVTAGGNVTATAGQGVSAANTNVAANAGTIKVTQAAGKTLTATGNGIETNSGLSTGATTVNVNGTILATGATGVKGTSTVGDITVNVATTGKIDPLIGIDLATASGALAVNNAGFVEGDNIGVQLVATTTGTTTVNNTGTINGKAAQGVILSVVDGAAAVAGTGTINGGTVGVDVASTSAGTISISGNTISGGTGGITALATGTGGITIDGPGNVSGGTGAGISATINNAANASNIIVNRTGGTVSGAKGIVATTNGVGNIAITSGGNVTATGGNGISATNSNAAANAGAIGVTLAAGKSVTATGGNGIETNSGISTGLTNIAVNGNVTSTDKSAVVATSAGGAIIVAQSAGSTITGAIDSIKVNNSVGGAINVNTAGTLVANNGSGVFVTTSAATADPITVTTNVVRSTGGAGTWGSQVRASAGSSDIIINSNGAMSSATAPNTIFGGILALTSGTSNRNITVNVNADIGTATDLSSAAQVQLVGASTSAKTLLVNINNANVFGGPGAIRVEQGAAGLGNVIVSGTGTGTLSATKAGAIGINARNLNAANNGNVTVDVTQNVIGVTQGINASTVGGGNVSATARGNVTATAGSGITATNANAAANAGTILVQVASGKLVSATGGNGITTNSGLSTGATTVVVAGEVKASGAGFAGIKGTSTAGNINVSVAATGKVDPEIGVDLATVDGTLLVNNAGLVQGDITAIKLAATGTGTGTVLNSGTITGGTNAVLGSTNNTAFTISNNAGGIMNGAINVTGSALASSQIANSGTWNASGISSFNGSWVNVGTTNVANGSAITVAGPSNNSGTIRFAGNGTLTTNLTNSGTLTTQNGITGGSVVLTGNYVGGGQFLADYNSGTITADSLRITGTATGTTGVSLNRVGTGFLPTGFLPIVTVVPGGAASLFTLATPLPTTGFVVETFGQNPANTSQWGIFQTVNPVFGDLGGVSALANSASGMLNDPASAFVTQKANPSAGESQIGLWMRGGAGDTKEDLTTTLSSGTFAASFNSRLRMSHQALQIGLDYGLLNMGGNGWNLHFGVTGGKLDAGAKRRGSTTNIQLDATFAGGYVFITNGALTLDASVRKEWREFKIASADLLAVSPQEADGDATVASVLASYRIGGATGFQATPQVGYSYGDSEIDPFAIDAFTQFVPGGDKTKLGHAGIKIGYRGEAGDLRFEPFVSATALRNWSNREDATVVFAGASTTNFDVDTIAFRKAMRYSLGLQGSDQSGKVSAFVVGSLTDGNRVDGGSVSVGARINF